MEFEQLKKTWASFDSRMQQQEGLKVTIIKEILVNKSDKALSRMINYNYFGLVLCIMTIPFLIWCITLVWPANFIKVMATVALVFMLFFMAMGIIQLKKLHRINFSIPVNENMYIVQKFNVFNKRYLMLSYAFAIVFVVVITVFALMFIDMELWRWWALAAALPLSVLLSIWEYKRMYRRNIDSIIKSLEELKELEEETEVLEP